MQYKTIVLAVLSALALSACGSGGGGVSGGVENKGAQSDKGSRSYDHKVGDNETYGKSAKATTTVSAPAVIGMAAKPAILANGIKLENRAFHFIYRADKMSLHQERLARLGLTAANDESTPEQIAKAKELKASLTEGEGMTTPLRKRLDGCLDTVIAGDAATGRACVEDYYIRVYALTGAMMDTWPQPSPMFEGSEHNQKFSSDRSFSTREVEDYATSGRVVANLSIALKSALAAIPPHLVLKGADDAYERITANLFAIPQADLLAWMERPAQRQKLGVDFEVVKGEANVGLTLHFFSSGMVLKADGSGWSVVMNGVPFHGGESGLLSGGKKEFTLEGNAGFTHETSKSSTANQSLENSNSQEISTGFKF